MKRRYSVTVRGRRHEWSFPVVGEPEHAEDWRADGLQVDEILNEIPEWLPWWLVRAWVFVEDVFRFRRPGGKSPLTGRRRGGDRDKESQ